MKNMKVIFKAYGEIIRLEKSLIPTILLISVVSAVMPFINIWFTSKIIDMLYIRDNLKLLIIYICSAVGINFALAFINSYFQMRYAIKVNSLYKKENQNVTAKLFSLEFQRVDDSDFKELLHKHTEAQQRTFSAFTQLCWMLNAFVSGLITVITSAVMVFPLIRLGFKTSGDTFFEKPLFLITIFIAIAVMAVIILVISLQMNKAWFKTNDEYSKLDRVYCYFTEMFRDYKTGKEIRLYKEQELIEETATRKILTEGEGLLKKASMHTAKSSSFIAILGAVLGFGIYLFIGVKGWHGLFSIGSLVLYCGAFMQIINGVMSMATTFGKTAEMVPLINYYFEIINTEDKMTYGEKELDFNGKFDFEFRNVSFRYPGSENDTLKNINVKIENGEHLAVVGMNGSGKTTFIKLLCRLYDVTDGEILINGINIKEYKKESIIKLFSIVFQDYKMFSLKVHENITPDEDYDSERLYEALDEANVKERVLRMKDKEKTYLYKNIEKDGVEISGGEAQKLALARALYKDAPIVILDEPTAALDPIAENEIYTRFNSFVDKKTAVYISHRLSSCAFCDRIIVFDKGEVLQNGTHCELLRDENGKYSELWNAQAQYYA